MTTANSRLIQSELNYEKTALRTATSTANLNRQRIAAQETFARVLRDSQARINDFRLRSADIAERLSQREILAKDSLAKANRIVADQEKKTGEASVAAYERQATAKIRLDNIQTNNAARLAAVERAKAKLSEQVANQIAAAELARLKVNETVTAGIVQNQATEAAARLRNAAVIQSVSAKEQQLLASQLASRITAKTVALKGLTLAYTGMSAATSIANGIVKQFGTALIAVTGFANRFAVSLRFGVLAISAFSAAFAINEASQFENALLKINNLTDSTSQEVEQFRGQLLELSKTIPRTPDELGAGLYFILSSGIKDAAKAFDILELAAKASVAGLGNVDDVTRVLTQTVNAYGEGNITAAQAAEILFATAKEGSAEVDDLTSTLGRVTTPAAQLGIEFDELGASIAALTNAGLPASQAVTALLGVMNQLLDPSAGAKELLKDFGTSIQELRQQVSEKGLIPAMQDLLATFDGNREVLTKLFPEIRGLVGIFALLSNEAALYEQALDGVSKSQGIIDEAFNKSSKTFSFQAGLLRNLLNRALINLGSDILPSVTKSLQDFGNAIKNNQDSIQEFLRISGLIIGFFISGTKVIYEFTRSIIGNQGIIIAALTAIGLVIAAVIGPWPLLILGVVAAVGILSTKFEEFKAVVINVFNSIPEPVQDFLKFWAVHVLTIVNAVIGYINNIVEGFKEVVSLVKNIIDGDWKSAWEDAKDIAGIAVENMIFIIEALLGKLPSIFAHFGALAINEFIKAIEKGLEGLAQIDLTDFLPPGLNIVGKAAAEIAGVNTKVGPGANIDLPEIPVPEIDLSGLPELTANLERTNQVVRSVSEEVDHFGQQSLAQVQQQFDDTSLSADDAASALDKLRDRLSKIQSAFSEALSTTQEEADLLLRRARIELAKLTERPVSNEDRLSRQPTDAAGRPITPFFATPEVLDPFGRTAQEAFDQQTKLQEDAIDRQLAVIDAQRGVWEAQSKVVDATLLTQQEQREAVDRILGLIEQESENIRLIAEQSSDPLAVLLPSLGEWNKQISEAAKAAESFSRAIGSVTNLDTQSILEQFERLNQQQFLADPQEQTDFISGVKILREAAQKIKDFFDGKISVDISGPVLQALEDIKSFFGVGIQNQITPPNVGDAGLKDPEPLISQIITSIKNQSDLVINKIDQLISVITEQLIIAIENSIVSIDSLTRAIVGEEGIKGLTDAIKELAASISPETEEIIGQQHGGFTTKPTLTLRGEHNLPELTLPLREPSRSKELLMSLPPTLMNQIMPRQPTQIGSLLGNVSVQGIITPEIESIVQREVRRQLSRSRAGVRAIGL